MLMLIVVMMFLLSFVVMFFGIVMSKSVMLDSEKGSSFECGFDPINSSRLSFSLQFFLIGIIFLIFDVEIVLMLPTPLCVGWGMSSFFVLLVFIYVLLFGLYFEWNQGVLEWLK